MKKIFLLCLIIFSMVSCHRKLMNGTESGLIIEETDKTNFPKRLERPQKITDNRSLTGEEIQNFIPNATAFRMNGNYSNNIGVSIDSNGDLTYFPAPSDITADSEPVELTGGWWLNCQGLGPNSVFTKYTFAEYASFTTTPSPEQIKLEIIPGSRITDFIELPMKNNVALDNIDSIKEYLKDK